MNALARRHGHAHARRAWLLFCWRALGPRFPPHRTLRDRLRRWVLGASVRTENAAANAVAEQQQNATSPISMALAHVQGGSPCHAPVVCTPSSAPPAPPKSIDWLTPSSNPPTQTTPSPLPFPRWLTARSGTSASSAWAPVSAAACCKIDEEIRHQARDPPCTRRVLWARGHRSVDPRAASRPRPAPHSPRPCDAAGRRVRGVVRDGPVDRSIDRSGGKGRHRGWGVAHDFMPDALGLPRRLPAAPTRSSTPPSPPQHQSTPPGAVAPILVDPPPPTPTDP